MKRILASLFIALFSANLACAVQVGEPESELVRAWGKPGAVRTMPNGAQVWKYRDGTTVWVAAGLVQRIVEPSVGNSIRRGPTLEAAVPDAPKISAPKDAATVRVSLPSVRGNAGSRTAARAHDVPGVGYSLLFGGLVVVLVSKIWFWVIAVRTGNWWIFGCLVPLLSWFFVFTYWRETRKPFAWQTLVALPLIAVGLYLTPNWAAIERASLTRTASSVLATQ